MTKKRNIISRLNKVDYFIYIICSFLAILMIVLFYKDMNSFSIKQNEEPIATISFKENTVQRKLDNRNIWEKVNLACDIYDGDSLRTSRESKVIAAFLENDVKINLDENTMIQLFKNKKKNYIDFIGGEIHIENTSSDSPIIIRAGTKAISILANSKAKLTAVESENADEKPVEAIIEVESGKVEITEIKETKNKVVDEEMVTVTAGNTYEIKLNQNIVEKPVVEETKIESKEEIVETVTEIVIETPVEEEEEKEEVIIEKPIEKKEVINEIIKEEPKVVIYPAIKKGEEGSKKSNMVAFSQNVWDRKNNGRNYTYNIFLKDIFGPEKRIPKDSAIEVCVSGVTRNRIALNQFQISTGEDEWNVAHDYKNISANQGKGIYPNEPFNLKTTLYLTKEIVNTEKAIVCLIYEPDVYDGICIINDFSVSVKVITDDYKEMITPVKPNYKKTISFNEIETLVSSYVNENGKKCYNGRFCFEPDALFGSFKSIEKGTKLKITLKGTATGSISWLSPELSQIINGNWTSCLKYENANISLSKNKPFEYTKDYIVSEKFVSSDIGSFALVYTFPNDQKPKNELIKINNCELTIEVIE